VELFLEHEMPFTLATNDDGIVDIQTCEEHDSHESHGHKSVASVICKAITKGRFQNVDVLKRVLDDAPSYAFVKDPFPPPIPDSTTVEVEGQKQNPQKTMAPLKSKAPQKTKKPVQKHDEDEEEDADLDVVRQSSEAEPADEGRR